MTCDRCKKPAPVSIMSRFNTDILCVPCEEAEHHHPDYAYAVEVEHGEVVLGNFNYMGVGWPGTENRIIRV